jgi:hypothetical protein
MEGGSAGTAKRIRWGRQAPLRRLLLPLPPRRGSAIHAVLRSTSSWGWSSVAMRMAVTRVLTRRWGAELRLRRPETPLRRVSTLHWHAILRRWHALPGRVAAILGWLHRELRLHTG